MIDTQKICYKNREFTVEYDSYLNSEAVVVVLADLDVLRS